MARTSKTILKKMGLNVSKSSYDVTRCPSDNFTDLVDNHKETRTNNESPKGKEKTLRFQSFSSCVEYMGNENEERIPIYRRAVSEVAITCHKERDEYNMEPSSDTGDDNNELDTEYGEYTRQVTLMFTYYEEVSVENEVKQCTYSRTVSQLSTSTESKNDTTKRNTCGKLWDKIKNKIRDDQEDETNFEKTARRKMTLIPTPEGTIEVNRPAKDVAKYCLHLLTSQFAGQTTWSIKTDVSKDDHRGPHLGDYLKLMDSYLRTFEKVEDFTGKEEYYLKVLSYIAKKRRLPKETEEVCYERLLCDSERFVQIYLQRGRLSQPIKVHNDFWGSRQQLLSAKVIADWVDPENGSIDPIFGVLLQPTAGRAGPGDAGFFHQVMFDGNGHIAYHSAVHDAFGYLKTDHDTGPGYDYMHDSHFRNSNPLAGQIDGMGFWKNVLRSEEMKPHVMDLTTRTLGIMPILNYQVEGNTAYL